MTEKAEHPKPKRKVFDLSWESEPESEDVDPASHEEESDEDDFEGHASGFNRPD